MLLYESSNYFPGLVGLKDVPLEKCPIYIFDLAGGKNPISSVGNFRHYMEALLNTLINYEGNKLNDDFGANEIAEYRRLCQEGLIDLEKNFSTETIFPNYEITIPIYGEPDTEPIRLKNQIERSTDRKQELSEED